MSAYQQMLQDESNLDEARRYVAAQFANEFLAGAQMALVASGQGPWIPTAGGFATLAKEYENYLKGDGGGEA